MANTTNYQLPLYDSTIDGDKLFRNFIDNITGLSSGSALNIIDSIMRENANHGVYHVSATGVNTYSTTSTLVTSYFDGLTIILDVDNSNTGASTLKINNLLDVNLKKIDALGLQVDLQAGDIIKNTLYYFIYDSGSFILISGGGSDFSNKIQYTEVQPTNQQLGGVWYEIL